MRWFLSFKLSFNNDNQKIIAEAGGIEMILRMMEVHGASNAGVAKEGCAALWRLAFWRKTFSFRP